MIIFENYILFCTPISTQETSSINADYTYMSLRPYNFSSCLYNTHKSKKRRKLSQEKYLNFYETLFSYVTKTSDLRLVVENIIDFKSKLNKL